MIISKTLTSVINWVAVLNKLHILARSLGVCEYVFGKKLLYTNPENLYDRRN